MKKIITLIISLSLTTFLVSGCSSEGQNLDGQKQIQFSLSQKGSNGNWEVTDKITGLYYNLEKLVNSRHELTIVPKNDVDYKSLTITLKIGDEVVGYYEEDNGEREENEFNAQLNQNGNYKVTQGTFINNNEGDTFWEEDVTIVIEYDNQKEEIKLG
ncbi:hypothetical protein [Virgibacillus sp. L01]|uniref:hypothetical protein n=1 Tax=Virgibacillus sp. L01 TaxID=3457429 RepID=UPI003FD54738